MSRYSKEKREHALLLMAPPHNLAGSITSSQFTDLKFIITAHSSLFYNVLRNEFVEKFKGVGGQV